MADEDKTTKPDEEVVENPSPDVKEEQIIEEVEETQEPAQEEPEQEEVSQEEDTKEVPEEKPSRREQLRIQSLLKKYGRPPEQPLQPKDGLNYEQSLDADPEVIKKLEADREAYGRAQHNAGLEQAKTIQFHTRLEVDAPRVESKYKFLDSNDKENFDPIRADAMNSLYLQSVGYDAGDPSRGIPESVQNPNVRYADFVEAQMEFAEALLADKQARTTQNIAKQAASTGLRPDGSSAKRLNLNQEPENMTDEELDASLASMGLAPKKR